MKATTVQQTITETIPQLRLFRAQKIRSPRHCCSSWY